MSLKAAFNDILFIYFFVLAPRNGHWGAWQPASWELTSCSGAYRTRHRNCDNPCPAHGGSYCVGSSTERIDCNECEFNNGGCDHRCINYYGCYSCACYPGYKASQTDWKKCVRKYTMRIFLSRFLIICPYKMVFKLSRSLFRKVLTSLFSSFIDCFMFTSPKIAGNNKVRSCYFNYWSRQTQRYIRLRIYSLKEKLITRYAFPIAYWRCHDEALLFHKTRMSYYEPNVPPLERFEP